MTTMRPGSPGIGDDLLHEMQAIAASVSCELLHAEFKGGAMRLVLDREEGGVTLEDCSAVSREVSALLDAWDFGLGRYTLEVSSPGLDRPLYRPEDYGRFQGHLVKVRFTDPASERCRTVIARLEGFDRDRGDRVTLSIPETDEHLELPLERVDSARLEIEL